MEISSIIGTIILILNGLITYKGLTDHAFFRKNCFEVDGVLIGKEYTRLLSSGFLHVNWLHFGFNMIALMAFSASVELSLGVVSFSLIYFASLIGGNLLALYIHRNHGDYSAVGASGAISGVVMASIVLYPDSNISLILLPQITFPGWIFGIAFVLISILGIKSRSDNIGHEAHLGGALVGVLLAIAIKPQLAIDNWWIVLLIVVPIAAFLALIVRNPNVMLIDNYRGGSKSNLRIVRSNKKKEVTLDYLLDKISKSGLKSLSDKERKLLDKLRNKL